MVKYLTLTFSNDQVIPKENEEVLFTGGLRHNQLAYLSKLPYLASFLNRTAVYPPPWLSLEKKHNKGTKLPTSRLWSHYFNTSLIQNVEFNPPFHFLPNGLVELLPNGLVAPLPNGLVESPTLSIKYYDAFSQPNSLDSETDIIVLSNFNNKERGTYSYSQLYDLSPHTKPLSITFQNSNQIIQLVDNLLTEEKIQPFYFLHIRRTDYLDNNLMAPPLGTRPYTSIAHIAKCLREINDNNIKRVREVNDNNIIPEIPKTLIISTDEKSTEYKKNLVKVLKEFRIIYEEEFITRFPEEFLNDNYYTYQVMNEMAKRCQINIGTVGYCRLGNKCDYLLSRFKVKKTRKKKKR